MNTMASRLRDQVATGIVSMTVLSALWTVPVLAQGTIAYSGFAPQWLGGGAWDFDGDSTHELSFDGTFIATPSNPSFHTDAYSISASSFLSVMLGGAQLQFVAAGAEIGPGMTSDLWSTSPSMWTALTISYLSPETPPESIQHTGPLADAGGTAFLGLRWEKPDGFHYGWARLTSEQVADPDDPFTIYFGPLAVDWAFEARPGVSIAAGAVPEPSTWALLAGGGVLVAWFRRTTNEKKG